MDSFFFSVTALIQPCNYQVGKWVIHAMELEGIAVMQIQTMFGIVKDISIMIGS